MRKLFTCLAALSAVAMHPATSAASSPFKEFSRAWTDREARYRDQHSILDKSAREAMEAYSTAVNAHAADVDAKLRAMLSAIQTAAFADGRGMILNDLRLHMVKKPSAAMVELWLQDHGDSMRIEGSAISATLAALRAQSGEEANPQAYQQDLINGLAASALFQGKLAELRLLNENLGLYVRAQSQEDVERRAARARIFGSIGAALTSYSNQPAPAAPPSWTATCDTFGNQTTCRGH